jgi:hypothetical protein
MAFGYLPLVKGFDLPPEGHGLRHLGHLSNLSAMAEIVGVTAGPVGD